MANSERTVDDYECRYGESSDVVPVLDQQIAVSDTPGNKFRQHCLSCCRWLPMTSREDFANHANPYVLPLGEAPARENLVPVDESDYGQAEAAAMDRNKRR